MSTRVKNLLVFLLTLVTLTDVWAARPKSKEAPPFKWDEVTPKDWEIPSDSLRDGFDAVILFERVVANDSLLLDGQCTQRLYRRIRILGAGGRTVADIQSPYWSNEQVILDIQGRTVLPTGESILLDPKTIQDKTVLRSEGVKIKQKSFSMPGVTDDCIIEYMILSKTDYHAPTWIYQSDYPMVKAQYRWLYYDFANRDSNLTSFFRRLGPLADFTKPSYFWERTGDNRQSKHLPLEKPTEYLFEVSNVPAYREAPYSPGDNVSRGSLGTYYGSESLPVVFWSSLSSAIEKGMKSYLESSKRISSIVAGVDTSAPRAEKISFAYNWVQQNIVNGDYPDLPAAAALFEKHPARRDNDMTADNVDEVVKRGYGTTFGINATFVALLRSMGIKACLARVSDRTELTFSRSAKYWQFDRTIAAVEDSAAGYRFYAPGEPYAPLGLIPWPNENGTALIEGAEGKLVTVPAAPAKSTMIIRQYRYGLDTNLVLSGEVETRWGGHSGRRLRLLLLEEPKEKRLPIAEKELADEFPDVRFDSLRIDNLDSTNQQLQFTYQATFKPLEPVGDRLILKPFDFCSGTSNPFTADKRTVPVSFRYAYYLNEAVQIDIPEGWSVEALPTDTLFENAVGRCGYQVTEMGNGILIQRVFSINQPLIPIEQYHLVQRLFQVRHDISEATIILTQSAAKL